jgi:hypothetical protein
MKNNKKIRGSKIGCKLCIFPTTGISLTLRETSLPDSKEPKIEEVIKNNKDIQIVPKKT